MARAKIFQAVTATVNVLALVRHLMALMVVASAAHAGRPLATDDAATADAGSCQVESWVARAGSDRALVLAPACGVAAGLELDAEYALLHPRDVLRDAAGLALKWAPGGWRTLSPAGEVNFGLKLATVAERRAGAGWSGLQTGALALATLKPHDAWVVHANLGAARERQSGTTATLFNLAVTWTLQEHTLFFVETRTNNRRRLFAGTVNTAGGRWWLMTDRFGLDLTASREAGASGATLWTLGFGCYGIGH